MKNLAAQHTEMSILASLMLFGDSNGLLHQLVPGDFYSPKNRELFRLLQEVLQGRMEAPDLQVVKDKCAEKGMDFGEVARIMMGEPVPPSSDQAMEILRSKRALREMLHVCRQIQENCLNAHMDPLDVIEQGQRQVNAVVLDGRITAVSMPDVCQEFLERVDKPGVRGLPVGIRTVDSVVRGLAPGHLVLVAARPGMGKSALAIGIAKHNAMKGTPVGIFSLEMPRVEIVERVIAELSGIAADGFGRRLEQQEITRVNEAVEKVWGWPVYIDDSEGLTITQVRQRARAMVRHLGIRLIIIDYVQLMKGGKGRYSNRTEEVGEISVGLKGMAKELGVPVVALAQLNRMLEQRANKRPMLSDLRESGSLEQDADKVIFIHRPGVYDDAIAPDIAEIVVAKNRQGQTGVISCNWNGPKMRFEEGNIYAGV